VHNPVGTNWYNHQQVHTTDGHQQVHATCSTTSEWQCGTQDAIPCDSVHWIHVQ
jgi:hypothetical protein